MNRGKFITIEGSEGVGKSAELSGLARPLAPIEDDEPTRVGHGR